MLSACFPSASDKVEKVHDLRVLGMRLDPPEIELPLDEQAPPIEVTLEALIVNPQGGSFTATLRGCPSPSSMACEALDPALLVDPLFQPLVTETLATQEFPAPPAVPELRLQERREFSHPLIASLFEGAPLGGLAGARPAFELSVVSSLLAADNHERAFKRLQISYPDPLYRQLLIQLGVKLCDAQGRPLGCMSYRPKVSNHNPGLDSISWQSLPGAEAGEAPSLVPDTGLELAPGSTVRIYPDLSADAAEPYQTIGINVEDQSLISSDYEEILAISWFASGGELALTTSIPERNFGAFNDYTAPMEAGQYELWMVIRDNRGGESFGHLTLQVTR